MLAWVVIFRLHLRQPRKSRLPRALCEECAFSLSSLTLDVQMFRCAFCIPNAVTGRLSLPTCPDLSPFFSSRCALFCTLQKLDLFFSSVSALFVKNHPGWGVGRTMG
jgi:hypothetical protein